MIRRTRPSGLGPDAVRQTFRHARAAAFAAGVAAGLAVAAPAQSADKLSGEEIRALLTGSKAQGTTDGLDDVTVVFAADGTVTGRAQTLLFVEEDTGTWEIDGDNLCVRWRSWADAERTCLAVERGDGGYESYTSDGALRTVFQVEKARQIGATDDQELLDLYAAAPEGESARSAGAAPVPARPPTITLPARRSRLEWP